MSVIGRVDGRRGEVSVGRADPVAIASPTLVEIVCWGRGISSREVDLDSGFKDGEGLTKAIGVGGADGLLCR